MYCIIKYIVQGKQARVKNADLRHPSCTAVMQKRKSASPVLNVLMSSGSKKNEPRSTRLSALIASRSQRMWAKVSLSAPHILHKGLLGSHIK